MGTGAFFVGKTTNGLPDKKCCGHSPIQGSKVFHACYGQIDNLQFWIGKRIGKILT